ncbi:hypothetical protein [Tautonia rosea]|uniref:hypothetical protein n=1 Tax=Tautonia rosea TaxID=2728037 RepID=UPI0014727B44|nr:hypothetical protein [Tautonia rosea]
MTRSARHRGPHTPRWVRGLLTGALFLTMSASIGGCGIPYVFRNISPLRPTGWSFAWPILPSQSQRLEEDIAKEELDRVPILDPVPGEFAPPPCLDPPSEAEIWAKVPKFRAGMDPFYTVQRNNARFVVEKIGESVDPCKVYPLAGPCQLIHCHYKCTVYFDELYWSDYPIPFNHRDARVEVIYIDKDYLRRCGGPAVGTVPGGG